MFSNAYLTIFYKHPVRTLNFFFFYTQTDQQTDRQTFLPIEALTRSLKMGQATKDKHSSIYDQKVLSPTKESWKNGSE